MNKKNIWDNRGRIKELARLVPRMDKQILGLMDGREFRNNQIWFNEYSRLHMEKFGKTFES